jgi:hypothetical protein
LKYSDLRKKFARRWRRVPGKGKVLLDEGCHFRARRDNVRIVHDDLGKVHIRVLERCDRLLRLADRRLFRRADEEGGIGGTREGYRIGLALADLQDRRERDDDQVVMGEVVTQRLLEPVGIVERRAGSRCCPDPEDIDGMGRRRPLDLADDRLAGHLLGELRLLSVWSAGRSPVRGPSQGKVEPVLQN